jgi:hypothetical protein
MKLKYVISSMRIDLSNKNAGFNAIDRFGTEMLTGTLRSGHTMVRTHDLVARQRLS